MNVDFAAPVRRISPRRLRPGLAVLAMVSGCSLAAPREHLEITDLWSSVPGLPAVDDGALQSLGDGPPNGPNPSTREDLGGKTGGMASDLALGDLVSPVDLLPVDLLVPAADTPPCAVDADHDGYTVCQGDCNDQDPLVSPGSFEVQGDHIDNNCNGLTDEPAPLCDENLPQSSTAALDYARAMDLCEFVVAADFPRLADPRARQAARDWGVFSTRRGRAMTALSTGIAADEDDAAPAFDPVATPQPGTDFHQTGIPNPLPMQQNCGGPDPASVNDDSELKLTLRVPLNAAAFAFDFNFLSAEYPEWVCKGFNDKFLVLLQSKQIQGNISLDNKGNPVTINNAYFSLTAASQLGGTGMEKLDGNGHPFGGATGWLTTAAPVTPGETITLRFILFDERDGIYDSQVLLDNFRWIAAPGCTRTTTDRAGLTNDCAGPDAGIPDAASQD